MAQLVFDAQAVRRIVEHALASKEHGEQITGYDPKTYQPITKPIGAAITLVHDDGVYIMSNAKPRDIVEPNPSKPGEGTSYVVHAKGCNPKIDANWWDRSRDLVGGDDFAEHLPWCTEIKALLDKGAKTIVIGFGKRKVSLSARF